MDPLSLLATLPQSPPRWDDDSGLEQVALVPMNERVWQRLPQEIVERVLAALSVPSLVRFCVVSKEWNSMIQSQAFIMYRLHHFKSRRPCYLMNPFEIQTRIGFLFYNPDLKMWHQRVMPEFLWPPGMDRIVASDGGLVLLGPDAISKPNPFGTRLSYVVCNPITGAYKNVAPNPIWGVHSFIRMVTEPGTNAFKIVMALNLSDISDHSIKIYHSRTGLWETTANMPPPPFVNSFNVYQYGAICNGVMYVVAGCPAVIVGLDLETGVWSEVLRLPEFILRPTLVERHGELVVVGGLDNMSTLARVPNPQAIGIWRMDQLKCGGGEVERLPRPLCKELQKWINFADFWCTGQHDTLFFSSIIGHDVMTYDIVKRTWHWLPEAPRMDDNQRCRFLMPLPFEPSLSPPAP